MPRPAPFTQAPYRPSNGTEGEYFMEAFCFHCERDRAFQENPDQADGCPILAKTFALDVTDPEYPQEWITDDKGARCTAFTMDPTCPTRCDKTLDMFGDVGGGKEP